MTDGERERRIFDIGELARLAGMQTSALRYYEREGLLHPAGRASGRRVFDEQGVRQLAAIDFWQEAGFTIKEIAWLFNEAQGSIETAKQVAAERIDELDRLIQQATHVEEFLTHVLNCVHGELSDCPFYERHLTERANRIVAGDSRRPLRRQAPNRGLPPRAAGTEPEL